MYLYICIYTLFYLNPYQHENINMFTIISWFRANHSTELDLIMYNVTAIFNVRG